MKLCSSDNHYTTALQNKYTYYNITACDNGNIQFHDQEESKLNNTTNANSFAHKLTRCKIMKRPFNQNNISTIKSTIKILSKILLIMPVE